MLTDVTGIKLTPGNGGAGRLGNGRHYDENKNPIECCCDECDWLMCCFAENSKDLCIDCEYTECINRKN